MSLDSKKVHKKRAKCSALEDLSKMNKYKPVCWILEPMFSVKEPKE